jgi:competence protein ComEA
MITLIKEHKIAVILGMGAVISAIVYIFLPFNNTDTSPVGAKEEWLEMEEVQEKVLPEEENAAEAGPVTVIVDVKGAVKQPGVYEAKDQDRVIDMINKAGGLAETADETQINFALRVEDEMVIYIPAKGEKTEELAEIEIANIPGNPNKEDHDGKVNINIADESKLQTLTGIGPSKAAAIIEYRDTNGPFQTIEDLKSISGIGEKTFEKLKDQIKVK